MFHASENNLDDLMRVVFARLLGNRGTFRVEGPRKGDNTEIFGALLELKNPRARLSRSLARARLFSALGELLWYLTGSENIAFIQHYIPTYEKFSNDGETANGAYGPRLFGLGAEDRSKGISNWNRVISLLREKPSTRNAVIQILSNTDIAQSNKDIPCTCTLQFVVRKNRLHLHTHMRSNDAFKGLPHDIFSFTMLQEIAANEIGVGLGTYHHSVASLHLYDDKPNALAKHNMPRTEAQSFLNEGLHDHRPMPQMPPGSPWPAIGKLIQYEAVLRAGAVDASIDKRLDGYWQDLARVLQIYAIIRFAESDPTKKSPYAKWQSQIRRLADDMNSNVYRLYVQDRLSKATKRQTDLFEDFGN